MAQRSSVVVLQIFLLLRLATAILAVEHYTRADFPADFVFGSGVAAPQYEGAAFLDGRTPSIWDAFAHSGHTMGANGDVACDGYHKYKVCDDVGGRYALLTQNFQRKEDIKLMVDTGLEAFRISISWSRLIPNGRGPINAKGLEYYNNLINDLISNGIQPHVTLIHLDLPQALEDEYGGWLSRKIVKDFVEFADVCFKEFGDRVLHWTTVNEVNMAALGGYDEGRIAPGRCSDRSICAEGNSATEPYIVAHNMLLAHSATAKLYKEKYKAAQNGELGLSVYTFGFVPYTNSTEDAMAAQRATDFFIGWTVNPVIFGDYPDVVKKSAQTRIPAFTKHESQQIKGSVNFIGVNHYFTVLIQDDPSAKRSMKDVYADMGVKFIRLLGSLGQSHTKFSPKSKEDSALWLKEVHNFVPLHSSLRIFDWSQQVEGADAPVYQYPVRPWGLKAVLEYMKKAYGNPTIYIQENGQMTRRDGSLNDTSRVEYVQAYIGGVLDAVRNGSNTKGYFVWTFLDCLELLGGYETSFGLYYVDLDNKDLTRYRKLSAHWYSNFLRGKNTKTNPNAIIQDKENMVTSVRQQFFFQ